MNLNSSGDQGQSQLTQEAGEGLRSSTIIKESFLYSVCRYPPQSQLHKAVYIVSDFCSGSLFRDSVLALSLAPALASHHPALLMPSLRYVELSPHPNSY